jgi:TonB family protein
MRIARAAYLLLLVFSFSLSLFSQDPNVASPTPGSYPNTASGLHALLAHVRELAANRDTEATAAAVREMEIPNAADWFHKTYPASADSWIGPYLNELEKNENLLQERFKALAGEQGDFVIRKVNDSPEPGRGMEWGMLDSMKQPVDIYFAAWRKPSDKTAKGQPFAYFMFIDGKFRWDSLVQFFQLSSSKDGFAVSSPTSGAGELDPKVGAYKVGNGVSAPRAIKTPDPEYTKEARKAKYQGTVVLWLIVDADGLPRDIKIKTPAGHGLDEKAVQAVSKWRFKPATKDGQPVPVQINVEVNFRLY